MTKKKLMIIVGIFIIMYWNFNDLLQLVLPIVPRFAKYIYGEHVLSYGKDFQNTYIIYLIGKIVLTILVFCLSDKNERNNSLYELTFLVGVGIVFSILTTKIALFFRFTYFFDIYLIIFIPKILNRLAETKIRRVLYMMCFVFASLYYVFLLYTNSAKCVPYVFSF